MNKAIAHILMNELTGLPYIDLFAGLVYAHETVDMKRNETTGGEVPVTYRFPASNDVYIADGANPDCRGLTLTEGVYDVSPNSLQKGILYFEDRGTMPRPRQGSSLNFSSYLRLVFWLNTKQFDSCNVQSLPARIQAAAIAAITGRFINSDPVQKLAVRVQTIPAAGRTLFASYTFNEAVSQYLMPPYEAFAIDLLAEFSISVNCLDPLTTNTIDPC